MKNRTLFLLLLALCPLAALTFLSLLDFFSVPPRSTPDDTQLLQSISVNSMSRLEEVKTVSALGDGLNEVHLILPLNVGNSKFLGNMVRYGEFAEDLTYLKNWNAVLGNLADTLQPIRKVTSKSLADAENVTRETMETADGASKSIQKARDRMRRCGRELSSSLDSFCEKNPDSQLASNGANYRLKLEEMVSLLSDRIDRAREVHKLKVSFLEAEDLLADGKFMDAFRLCSKIRASEFLDSEFRRAVSETGYEARTRSALTELDEIEASADGLERKMENILVLNQKVKDAGKGLEKETQEELGGGYQEKMSALLVRFIEESSMEEIRQAMERLEKTPPSTFSASLKEAGDILLKVNEMEKKMREGTGRTDRFELVDELRESLRVTLAQLLADRLPSDVSANEKIQEAEMRDGRILTGYFKEVQENGKTSGFKIYASYEEFQNPTSSKGTTSVDEFHALPGKSLEARCVEEYLEAREKLLKDPSRRAAWNEFLGKCERMAKELEKWEGKAGVKPNFSLKKPMAIAKGTLKDENWSIWEEIF